MNIRRITFAVLIFAGLLAIDSYSLGQQPQASLPNDPEKAWAEVEKVHEALRRPNDWEKRKPSAAEVSIFQKQLCETAVSFADKAREFIRRFATNENIGDARFTVIHALNHAVAAGDTNAEKQIASFVAAVLEDQRISEDERADVLLFSGNTAYMKKAGMRLFTEGRSSFREESETALIEATRASLKVFPTNVMLYNMLIAVADRSKGERQKELATEVLDAPGAPAGAKIMAGHVLKGTRPYQVGRPLDIRFTALDGREVDLAKFKGKVVLVDFWATDCGPCVGEMPTIKAAYEKFHTRGFEVVAISLDTKESALRRFIKEKALPWPQHFDGKGWENKFALQFGIYSIPTMWLVDKQGNLRVAGVRSDLEEPIEALIEEPSSSAPK